jgi:hypothetical protein
MSAEKTTGKPIKDELLTYIKEQVNKSPFPYLDFIVKDGEILFTPEFINTLTIDIQCKFFGQVCRKLCTLITGCDIIRFIPTGDNFKGVPVGFNVYGKIMNAYPKDGIIRVHFEWKGVCHE